MNSLANALPYAALSEQPDHWKAAADSSDASPRRARADRRPLADSLVAAAALQSSHAAGASDGVRDACRRYGVDERHLPNTGVVYFAEDGDGIDGGAVPAPVAELLLTLAYRDDGARLDRVHHLDVASTDVLLLAHQSHEAVALVLRPDVRQRARRRYRHPPSSGS